MLEDLDTTNLRMGQVLQRKKEVDENIEDDEDFSESVVDVLPYEIVMKILKLLPADDLKTAVLVCRRWRYLGEDPVLWTWCKVSYKAGCLTEMGKLSTRRLQNMQYLRVWYDEWKKGEMTQLLQAIHNLDHLREVSGLNGYNYKAVDTQLFSKVLNKLEVVAVNNIGASEEHLQSLFARMSQEESRIRKLNVTGNNLSSIAPDVLGAAVTKLEEIRIGHTNLTREQVQAIFSHLHERCHLTRLYIPFIDLFTVQPEIFASVVSNIEKVDIGNTKLQQHQATELFAATSTKKARLKNLIIRGNDLSGVPATVFAKGVSQIEVIDMECANINTQQASLLFSFLLEEKPLRKLSLIRNNLSEVDPTVLAGGVTRLQEVDLHYSSLSGEQVTCILNTCLEENTGLTHLTVRDHPDVEVNIDLIMAVKNKLGDHIIVNNI